MTPRSLLRLISAALLLGTLSACAVVPAPPGYYRPAPVVVETYPAYRYAPPPATIYYERRYDDGYRHHHHERRDYGERRHEGPRGPVGDALRMRRDIHRSLGLPF